MIDSIIGKKYTCMSYRRKKYKMLDKKKMKFNSENVNKSPRRIQNSRSEVHKPDTLTKHLNRHLPT